MENVKDKSTQEINEDTNNQFGVPFELVAEETIITGTSEEALKKLLRPVKLPITKFGSFEYNRTNK